jgi:SnoaL-like domain
MDDIAGLIARAAIEDGLARYCRGMDRMDDRIARSAFHPGATVDYGEQFFRGTADDFVEWVHRLHAEVDVTVHRIANTLIRVDGDRAVSEASGHVMLIDAEPDGLSRVRHGFGRYLDRWLCVDGVWAIEHRVYRRDVGWEEHVAASPGGGRRDPDDPSFVAFGGLL